MSFYNGSRADTKPSRTTSDFGESPPSFSDSKAKVLYDRPIFSERFRNFSPSARKSGEEILKDLKEQLRREGDMFFNQSAPDWSFSPKSTLFSKAEDGEDFPRRTGMDDLRSRHGMFRMPAWMSEDDDMSDLAARMSHTPHFATMGRRGGPWRERRSSGGSAMSATSDDSCDAPPTDKSSQCSGGSSDVPSHEIPIRLEAPCPPSMMQQHQPQQTRPEAENEPISPLSSAFSHRKDTQYPVRTTSAVDATQPPEHVTRTTRCSSAPPEMADQPLPQEPQKPLQQRFVSKINITPQSPQSPTCSKSTAIPFSPLPAKFNTVPKPFVPANKQHSDSPAAPYVFEQPSVPEPPQQQSNQNQQQQPHPQMPSYMSQHMPQQQPQPTQQQQNYPSQQQQQYPPQQQQQYPSQQQQQYPTQQQFHPQEQQFQHQQYQPQQHQQQQQQQQQSPRQGGQRPSVVRNIPIFVEGRDGPVTSEESGTPPKNSSQWGPSWNQQQHFYQQQPAPQQQQHCHQQQQKPQFRQHAQHQQQAPQQQSQPIPTPVPAPPPPQYQSQNQQQQHQQQSEPPQAKPQPQPARDPRLTQIEAVQASVDEYKAKVDAFTGVKNDREFLYLDEMLTRALLQLDNVDPDGREDVRQARRAVIKNINAAISALETKVTDAAKKNKEKTPENGEISMETDTQEQSADTKKSQEGSDKTVDGKEPAESLPNNADATKNAEETKVESMETADSQDPTSASNDKEAPVTTST